MGKRQTAIGTLVERHTRYVMLFGLPDGNTAQAVRDALTATVQRLPTVSLERRRVVTVQECSTPIAKIRQHAWTTPRRG
jgi:IS30 family transposase